jgi:NCS1 family nucleobase:cation symporter-1
MANGTDRIEAALAETLPLLPEERSWSFRDMLAVKSGLSIATWGFLFGGATGQLVGFVDGLIALLFGTAVGLGILFFALLLPVYRHGCESFVFLRSAFGTLGASLLAIPLVLGLVPFSAAILSTMAGAATGEVLAGLDLIAPEVGVSLAATMSFAVLGVSFVLAARGSDTLRLFNLATVPFLVLLSGGLLVAVFLEAGWDTILSAQPPETRWDRPTRLMLAVELNIVAAISWFGLAGNLMRYGSTARGATWGTWIGLLPVSLLPALAGLASTLALGSPDPVQWMTPLVGPILGLAMLLILIIANVSSLVGLLQGNVTTIIQNFGAPMRRLGFAGMTGVLCVIAALIIWFATDALYARFYSITASFGAIFAACVGVLLADRLVLRRSQVDLAGLHEVSGGPYRFWLGINPAALIALGAGFLAYLSFLEPISQTPSAAFRYCSASLPAIGAAFCVHLGLSRLIILRVGRGGYPAGASSRAGLPEAAPAE